MQGTGSGSRFDDLINCTKVGGGSQGKLYTWEDHWLRIWFEEPILLVISKLIDKEMLGHGLLLEKVPNS